VDAHEKERGSVKAGESMVLCIESIAAGTPEMMTARKTNMETMSRMALIIALCLS
jgi:hypothetical protein